jgi:tripartite-type tricarboxylate transporter receptor subunit TctC
MRSIRTAWALCRAIAIGGGVFGLAVGEAPAQQFPIPGKPVRIVVPLAAGGGADVQARIVGRAMAETLGVPVIIDNKPGASTLIGTKEVQKATPDGHTLLYTIGLFVQVPLLSRNPPWDVFTDFTPITAFVQSFTVLTAHSSAPFNTVAGLVAYAKANPGKLSYASFGQGSSAHLNGEKLKRLAGIDIVHIPYKGAGDAMRDQISGNVTLSFDGPTTAMANVESGHVKYIATVAETRSAVLPNLPTLREEGFHIGQRGYQFLLGPRGMPSTVLEAVYKHAVQALRRPEVVELLKKSGNEVSGMSPAEAVAEIRRSYEYNEALIAEIGIKLD